MPKGYHMFRHAGNKDDQELPGMSHGEIARYFGVTKQAICQVEKKAIRKIWRRRIIELREAKSNG